MRRMFIMGTGTGVGKTLLTASLAHQLQAKGHTVSAIKPVISGYVEGDTHSDTSVLARAQRAALTMETLSRISPWRFSQRLSPHMAAGPGEAPAASAVMEHCRKCERDGTILLVEAAGGIMTPLNDTETFLHLARMLGYENVLVGGSYLGAISHTLTALAAMRGAGLTPHTVVVSESADGAVTLADTVSSIRAFAGKGVKVHALPRIHVEEEWRNAPPLTDICLS